jgi:ABC-type amino acid transport substrate-binding protein
LKNLKRITAIIFSALMIMAAFAGCAKNEQAAKITKNTMIIAYTEENAPFIYTDENGTLTGFDVELIKNTFKSFKGDYKDYAFVKVDENYVLNEDICYTDENGNDFSAILMCGGTQKNVGTVNEDVNWSVNIIENNIITVVPANSEIKNYNDLKGAKVGVVAGIALDALNKNTTIKNSLASVTEYASAEEAMAAFGNDADAVVIEDFDFYNYNDNSNYTVLNGALDTVEYAFRFAPSKDYSYGFNEAVREMQSADYGDGDTLTPLVEKYFGYADACVFSYETDGDK